MARWNRSSMLIVVVGALVVSLAQAKEETPKTAVEHKESDLAVIRQTLEEVVKKPRIHFVEYGPDGETGSYKYQLSIDDEKEFIIRTKGPVAVPIIETIRGTREEKDRKLLMRIIGSKQIKSLDTVKRSSEKE